MPIVPGVVVLGTPGWLDSPVVPLGGGDGLVEVAGGGVAGETPGEPAAEPPPGDEGGAA